MLNKMKKGFTLIELLVVIAIIAILATVVILNVTGARAKAAKAKVAADMNIASKIAGACVSFDGTLTTTPAAGAIICTSASTIVMDTAEAAAATGNYPPANPSPNFTYTRTVAGAGALQTLSMVVSAPNSGGTLTCSLTGCVPTGGY